MVERRGDALKIVVLGEGKLNSVNHPQEGIAASTNASAENFLR